MLKDVFARLAAEASWDNFLPDLLVQTVGALVGAAIGAYLAMRFAQQLQAQQEKRRLTQRLIDEFLGAVFLRHRIVAAKVRRSLADETLQIDDFAAGYWHPGREDYFTGEVTDGFDQHQHVEVLIGWVIRVSNAIASKQVSNKMLSVALRENYLWLNDLLRPLACETSRQVSAAKISGIDASVPRWVADVDRLRRIFHLELVVSRPKKATRDQVGQPE